VWIGTDPLICANYADTVALDHSEIPPGLTGPAIVEPPTGLASVIQIGIERKAQNAQRFLQGLKKTLITYFSLLSLRFFAE
jgi:hypothetical protein